MKGKVKWDGTKKVYDDVGREIPDPTPIEVPLQAKKDPVKTEVERIVKTTLSQKMEDKGSETFEEFNDFEVEDEEDSYMYPPDADDVPVGKKGPGGIIEEAPDEKDNKGEAPRVDTYGSKDSSYDPRKSEEPKIEVIKTLFEAGGTEVSLVQAPDGSRRWMRTKKGTVST